MADSLGDRMKNNYENRNRHFLLPRMPVMVRVDGRAFHTYTKGMTRPFSDHLHNAMIVGCQEVIKESSGCVAAYTQSDEASFLFIDYQTLESQPWFGYSQSKVETAVVSSFQAGFSRDMDDHGARFDGRAFNIPREEVFNAFLWRMKDWERNSLQMFARSKFSHKELENKGHEEIHEMLHSVGANWTTDVSPRFRNGTWVISGFTTDTVQPNYGDVATLLKRRVYCDLNFEDLVSK